MEEYKPVTFPEKIENADKIFLTIGKSGAKIFLSNNLRSLMKNPQYIRLSLSDCNKMILTLVGANDRNSIKVSDSGNVSDATNITNWLRTKGYKTNSRIYMTTNNDIATQYKVVERGI